MVRIDPVSKKNPRNYRGITIWVGNVCFRYPAETIIDRDFKILPMASIQLEGFSIYSHRKDLKPILIVIAPERIKISIKHLLPFNYLS